MAIKFNSFLLLCMLTFKLASSFQEDKRISFSPTQRTITKWSCGILVDCFYFEVTHPHCGKGTAVLDGSDYVITFKAQNSCKQHAIKKLSVYWFELSNNNNGITYARCSNQQRCVLKGKILAALKGNLQLYIRVKVPTSHQIITLPVFLKLQPMIQENKDEWNCNKTNVTKKTKNKLHNNNGKKNSTKPTQDTYWGFVQRIKPIHSNTTKKNKPKHTSFNPGKSHKSKFRKWKTTKHKVEGQQKFGNVKGKTEKADNTKNLKPLQDDKNFIIDDLKSFRVRVHKNNKPPEFTGELETVRTTQTREQEEIVTKSYDGSSVSGITKTSQKPKTKNVIVNTPNAKIVDNSTFKKLTDHYEEENRKFGSFSMNTDTNYRKSNLKDEEGKPVKGPTTAKEEEFTKISEDFLSVNEDNKTLKENMKNVAKCLNFFCSHPHSQGCVHRQVMQCIHYAEGADNEKLLRSIKHDMLNLLEFFNVTNKDLDNIEKFAQSVAVKLSSNVSSGLSTTLFGTATAKMLTMLYNASYQGSRRALHDMLIAKSDNAVEIQNKGKDVTLPSCLQLCGHEGSQLTWTSWEPWSSCTSSCGKALTIRLKTCLRGHFNPPQNAKHCDGYVKSEAKKCKYIPCPTEITTPTGGHWSFWSHWSACSVTCGLGRESTRRICKTKEEDNDIFDKEPTDRQESLPPCKGLSSRTRMCITSSCNMDSEPEVRKVVEGSDTVLQCGLGQGPMRTVYWITPTGQKISKLTNQSRFHIRNDDLVVKETQRYDSGVYHCIVKKGQQQSSVDTKIEVLTCLSYPCQNGGSCKIKHRPRRKHMVNCFCRHGFHGDVCQYQTERLSYAFILTILLLMVLIFIIILGIFLGISTLRKRQKPEPKSLLPAQVCSESSGSKDNKDPEKPALQDCGQDKQKDIISSTVSDDGPLVEIKEKDYREYEEENEGKTKEAQSAPAVMHKQPTDEKMIAKKRFTSDPGLSTRLSRQFKGEKWYNVDKMKEAQSAPAVTHKKPSDEKNIANKRFLSDPGLRKYLSRQFSNIRKPQRNRSIEDVKTPTSSNNRTKSKQVQPTESIASSHSANVKKKVSFQKSEQRNISQDTFKDHMDKKAPVWSSNYSQIQPDSNVSVERSVYKPPKSDIKLSLESSNDIRFQLDSNDSEDNSDVIYMHPETSRKASLESCEYFQYHSDNMQLRPNEYFDNGHDCDIDMDKIKVIASDSATESDGNWYDNFGNEVNFKHRATVRPETRCGTRPMPTNTSKRQSKKLTPNIVNYVNNEDFDDDVQFGKNEHQMDFIHKRTYKPCNIDCNPNVSNIYACIDQEDIHHVSSGDSITTSTKTNKQNKKSVHHNCRENSYKMSSPARIHAMNPQTSKTSKGKQACDAPNFYDKTASLHGRQMSKDSIKKQLLDSSRTSDLRNKIEFTHKQTYKQNKAKTPNMCHATAIRDQENIPVLGSKDFRAVMNKGKHYKESFEENYHKRPFKISSPQGRGQSVLPLKSEKRNSKKSNDSTYFDYKRSPVQGRQMLTDAFEKFPSGSRRYVSHKQGQGTASNRVYVTDKDKLELTNTQFSDNLKLHGPDYFLTSKAQFPELDNYLNRKSVTQSPKRIHSSQDPESQISKFKTNADMEGLSSIFKSMSPDLKLVMSEKNGSDSNITYSDIQSQAENSKNNAMSEQNRVLYSSTPDWLQERQQDNDTQSLYSEPLEVNHFSHTKSSKPIFATIQRATPTAVGQTNHFTDSVQEALLSQTPDDDNTVLLDCRNDESSEEGALENTNQWGMNSDESEHTITECTVQSDGSRSHEEDSVHSSKISYPPKSPFELEMDKYLESCRSHEKDSVHSSKKSYPPKSPFQLELDKFHDGSRSHKEDSVQSKKSYPSKSPFQLEMDKFLEGSRSHVEDRVQSSKKSYSPKSPFQLEMDTFHEGSRSHEEDSVQSSKKSYSPKSPFQLEMDKFHEGSRSHEEDSVQSSEKSYRPKSPFQLEMDKWDTSTDDCSLTLQNESVDQSDIEQRPISGQDFDSPSQYPGVNITPSSTSSSISQCSQKPMSAFVADTTFEFDLSGENKQNVDALEKDNSTLHLEFEDSGNCVVRDDVEEDGKGQHSSALTSSSPESDDQTSPRSRMCLNHYQMVYGTVAYRSNSSSPERHCCEEEVSLQD